MIINIRGMLTRDSDHPFDQSYPEIREQVQAALDGGEDVVLDIDSGGGDSIGVKALADFIFDHRDHVTAYISGCCASAAYYIAAACGHITAAEDAVVGSVGTIGWPPDIGDAKVATLSPLKNSGEDLQAILDDGCERFLRDVARYRGFSGTPEEVSRQVGAGAMMTARDALSRQLIDEVKTMDDEIDKKELDAEGLAAMLPRLLEKIDELAAKMDSADERVGLLEQRLDELKKVDEEVEEPVAECKPKMEGEEVLDDEKKEDEIMACVIDAAKATGLIKLGDEAFARKLAMTDLSLFRDYLMSRPKPITTKMSLGTKTHAPAPKTRNERAKQIMQAQGCDYVTALAKCMEE